LILVLVFPFPVFFKIRFLIRQNVLSLVILCNFCLCQNLICLLPGVENGNNVETVENGNNVETADPQSSTPATKSKRGRKRKIIVPEIHVEGGHSTNDNSTADISMTDGDVSLKNDVIKTPTGPGVTCGNCEMMFKNKSTFLLHAAALHGGLVSIITLIFFPATLSNSMIYVRE
jgi:hypothetical protein